MFPICAAPDTPIATPQGERAIAGLAPGDLVYSVDASGIVVVPIVRVGSTPVVNHRVVRVELAGGTMLEISAAASTTAAVAIVSHAFGRLSAIASMNWADSIATHANSATAATRRAKGRTD